MSRTKIRKLKNRKSHLIFKKNKYLLTGIFRRILLRLHTTTILTAFRTADTLSHKIDSLHIVSIVILTIHIQRLTYNIYLRSYIYKKFIHIII